MTRRVRVKDVAVIVAVAATTCLATGLLCRRPRAFASKPTPNAAKQPVLKVGDVDITLTPAKPVYGPKDKPTLTLKAVNRGTRAASVKLTVEMFTQRTPSVLSRVMLIPKSVWTQPCELSLGAGRTETLELSPGVAVGAGSTATFVLKSGKNRVSAAAVAAPGPRFSRKVFRLTRSARTKTR